jgi:hypothetical protein
MHDQAGDVVSGVIWVQLIDDDNIPIVDYPAEDMWLVSHGGTFAFVHPGTCADGPSDAEGLVVWREPLAAGGMALEGLVGLIGGQPLNLPPLQSVRVVSPDFNGDLEVNVGDLVSFSVDYAGDYDERSDLVHNGQIDLSDLTVFAAHYGHGCP